MKNNIKKLLLLGAFTTILTAGCVDSSNENAETVSESSLETVQEDTIQVTFEVQVDETNSFEKTIDIEEGSTIQDVTIENFVVLENEGFIESIDGYSQSADDNIWWVFEVNEEMVTVSASEYVLEDGDFVKWELMAF